MRAHFVLRTGIFFAIVSTLIAGEFVFLQVANADACPNTGERPATANDAIVKNGIIAVGTCYNPNQAGIEQTAEEAKQKLSGIVCNSGVNIKQLDPKFSVCATKFMEALRQVNPTACIESAFRDPNQQAAACRGICGQLSCPGLCAAPGKSYHQKGLAIDIGKLRLPLQQFWQLASQSGLGNPTGLHRSDPNHIQVMNGGSNCADVGYSPTSDDTFIPGPVSSNPYFGYGPSPMTSMQPVGTPTASPISTPAATPQTSTQTTATQPQICTPEFSCTNNIMYYKTTSCTTQIYQTCPYGCNGNACNMSSSTSQTTGSSLSSAFSTSTNTNTNSNTDTADSASSSVSDILNSYINPTAVEIGTSTSLAFRLNPTTGEIEQISQTPNSTALAPAANTITSVQPISGQQTFTSGDLSGSYSSISGAQQPSALQKVLDGMKSALLWALNALRSL